METLLQPQKKKKQQFGIELDALFWGFEQPPTFWSNPFKVIVRNVKLYERMESPVVCSLYVSRFWISFNLHTECLCCRASLPTVRKCLSCTAYTTFNSVAVLLLPNGPEGASDKARTGTQFFWTPCHCLKFKTACFSLVSNDVQWYN